MLFGAKEAPATMRKEDIQRRGARRGGGLWPIVGAVAMAVALSGCSSVPDAVNPVKWYENTVEFFSGDEAEETKAEASDETVPGDDKPFPNLATVPDRPEVSSAEERRRVAEGLVSDSERRRYAQDVARQGAPTQMLQGEPSPSAEASAPAALPATPPPAEVARAAPAAPPPPAPTARTPSPSGASTSAPPPPQLSAPAPATEVAPRPSRPLPSAGRSRQPFAGEAFETVVVSSSGVDTGPSAAATPFTGERMLPSRPERVRDGASARGGSLKVATIQYGHGSAALDSRDRTILRNVVALQRERGGLIRVVGHASARTANMDAVRHKMVNYEVSAERAEVVAKTLTDMGAPPRDIVVVAKADTEPLYYEVMPSGEAGNRRTEVYLDF